MKPINVYVPNLPARTDRLESIVKQYEGRNEFSLHILTPVAHEVPSYSLWATFVETVKLEKGNDSDFFVFGEDDHYFTEFYSADALKDAICWALSNDIELLSGGMSWIDLPQQTSCRNLFRVAQFSGMQFTIIFKKAYDIILSAEFNVNIDVLDRFLGKILNQKVVMFPFISKQEEFGYSDVTPNNNIPKRVANLFQKAETTLRVLDKVKQHFENINNSIPSQFSEGDINECQISTHIIHLPERLDRETLLYSQYADRKELSIKSIEACRHTQGAIGLWNSICQAVSQAKVSGEDAVLICEDDHVFTKDYRKDAFFRYVYEAAAYGSDLLSGGVGGFGNAIRVTDELFWVDWLWCTQFIVIYKKAYDTILQADFKETDVADEFLSKILLNKMVIFPFISKQLDFGYSDVTSNNNEKGKISSHFANAEERFLKFIGMEANTSCKESSNDLNGINIPSSFCDKLNIGCGHHVKDGWLNVDLLPTQGAYYMNAAQPFPLADETFRFVFSEHLFEHLSYEGGKNMLHEAYRILKPGGTLRIALPTLEFLQALLNNPEGEQEKRYILWSLKQYNRKLYEDFLNSSMSDIVSFVVNMFMREWGHQMLYTHSSLKHMLKQVGFKDIQEVRINESIFEELQGLEEHGNIIPDWANVMETSVFEATK